MSAKVWVVSEQPQLLAELVGGAQLLAGADAEVVAVSLGVPEAAESAARAGASKVYCYKLEENAAPEDVFQHLAGLVKEEGADLILVGATKRGKTLAALLAAELGSGLATEAFVEEFGSELKVRRYTYGGLGVSVLSFASGVPVVSVPPRTFEAPEPCASPGPVVEVASPPGKLRVVEKKPKEAASVDLESAEVVITIGRGVKNKEDLVMFEELAGLLGGVLACTRPVAEEEGYRWFPQDSYIGISGRVVKPRLYISVGSSGQIQHLAGCRDAKVLVGIDKNEDAPIFEACDYGIVGDLYQVVPELVKRLKEVKAS